MNHTSSDHEWFQRARKAPPESPERDWYVWSDTVHRYEEARIIFTDTETSNWSRDPVANAYYWHRFFSHQPDLNFDNPGVHEEVLKALDFWMEMGVDGLRLDAVPYLYEREGTNNENLPETHAFLKKLRSHMDARFAGRMLLAEANQWPEDSIAYFGDPAAGGDECHMAFHFPLMPRLFMAIRMEDRFPIVDILQQTPPIPERAQWATFLRNHDELTLEMVTDEERDYMYRVYAADKDQRINVGIRRRLAPLLGNDRRRIELMNALLLSLPGTPVIYYGDEIGMGDNFYLGDRNGVRTPMQWSADKNAGFSRANPQRLYLPAIVDPEYHFGTVNVEAQDANPHSLLWWMRRVIALRRRHRAFSRGTLELLAPDNHRVLAFLRRHRDHEEEDETLLVVVNLSRFVQHVELDLSAEAGLTPVELFGRSAFPRITQAPYPLTLSQHSFIWFSLVAEPSRYGQTASAKRTRTAPLPAVPIQVVWQEVFQGGARDGLERALAVALPSRRWFAAKAGTVRRITLADVIPMADPSTETLRLLLLGVESIDGEAETYAVPVAFASGTKRARNALVRLESERPEAAGLLVDPLGEPGFTRPMLHAIEQGARFRGARHELVAVPAPALADLRGTRLAFKAFRRLEPGVNPDLEISRFLTEKTTFRNVPRVAGWLEIRTRTPDEAATLGFLREVIPDEGDAWRWTMDALGRYFERAVTGWGRGEHRMAPVPAEPLMDLAERDLSPDDFERLGTYLPSVRLLGERTAELHLALASARSAGPEDRAFAPEPFTQLYQRSLYDSMRTHAKRSLRLLRQRLDGIGPAERLDAERVLAAEDRVVASFHRLMGAKLSTERIRCHGDYHLGQVRYTGRDFVIVDFEGEPSRSLSERRLKRSPFRDVAGMVRSLHAAASAKLLEEAAAGVVSPEASAEVASWAGYWQRWVSASFLRAYLDRARGASFMPASRGELATLLDVFALEKALLELAHELHNRPAWVGIPLQSILNLLGESR
jgi:maltose alpha-D-glucosyltransferase/alpha-amylase